VIEGRALGCGSWDNPAIGGAPFRLASDLEVRVGDKSPKQKNKSAKQKQSAKTTEQRQKVAKQAPKAQPGTAK